MTTIGQKSYPTILLMVIDHLGAADSRGNVVDLPNSADVEIPLTTLSIFENS